MVRQQLIERHRWLGRRDLPMLVSADLEGLLCAALLHHHLGWKLAGLDDGSQTWVEPTNRFNGAIGVNLTSSRNLPGISRHGEPSRGCLNPNGVDGLGPRLGEFPLSTPLLLLWLFELPIRRELTARLLLLSVGDTWQTAISEPGRVANWLEELPGYDWDWLLAKMGTDTLERRFKDQLLAPLNRLLAQQPDQPLDEVHINPDWDLDVILNFFAFAGTWLKWSPPVVPALELIDWDSWSTAGKTIA